MALKFKLNKSLNEIKEVYNHNVSAFSDTQDFDWTIDSIKKEVDKGWKLYSALEQDQIIAAMFVKEDSTAHALYTKNTPIRMEFRGKGYSHEIKDFYEELAKEEGLKKVVNYCSQDNFRMVSLNERHGYKTTGNKIEGNSVLVEWAKDVNDPSPRDK